MQDSDVPTTGWTRAIPRMSEEALLLAELSHRVRNEVSASIAAMWLSLSRNAPAGRDDMVRAAIGRLEGFGELLGVMTVSPGDAVDLGPLLERMCQGLARGRVGLDRTAISVDAGEVVVAGAVAQRILMIAHELIHNAMRHALEGRRGLLAIVLRADSRSIRLAVVDDGPGVDRSSPAVGRAWVRPWSPSSSCAAAA